MELQPSMQDNNRVLNFYTDGAYSSATHAGGWSSLCIEDNLLIDLRKGGELETTNNRMELMGFLTALQAVSEVATNHAIINIYTDSAYIANAINEKWLLKWMSNGWTTADKRCVKNKDLWRQILALYIRNKNRFVEFNVKKVQAHANDPWNNAADLYARKARLERKK